MKIKFSINLVLFYCLCISSCTPEKHKYRIGFAQCTGADSWRKFMHAGMNRELASHPELEFYMKDAAGNSHLQIKQIQEFIDEKVDLLIVSPNETIPITPMIEKAEESNIPVIIVDRRIASDKYTAYVGANNYNVGQNAGKAANALLKGKGNIIEIGGLLGSSPENDRHNGFLDYIKSIPNLKLVKKINGDWERSSFEEKLIDYLSENRNIQLIFSHNDRMALGVKQVLSKLELENQIKIIGVDGLSGPNGGIDLVDRGILAADILYPTGGEEAIQLSMKILDGQKFNKTNDLPSTIINSENVRAIKLQAEKIDEKLALIDRKDSQMENLTKVFSTQKKLLFATLALLVVVLILGGFLFYLLKENQRSNKVLALQNISIQAQKDEIERVSLQAKQATEEKLRFYSYISHEFRTPLSLILTPTEDLLQHKTLDAKETKNTLHLVLKNANRLLRLVDQLLDLRKLDAGKMTLQANNYDLIEFLKEIVADFKPKAQSKNIDLQFVSAFKEMPFVFDAEKLDKVIFNILSNAFKYTPEGGFIHVNISKRFDKIEISIADNGIGMEPDEKKHAFDLFYRGNKNISLGTGLGLALSQEFVILHEGTIELESEKGKGTTFKIVLPQLNQTQTEIESLLKLPHILDENDVEIEKLSINGKNSSENSIVIIEDNADLNSFLYQKFEKNYHVFSEINAEKGWETILATIPDIIICDVMLPGQDGFLLTQKIKEDFRTSHIPVILLTAKGQIESQIEGTKAGADAYMTKPFNQALLEQKVKSIIENTIRMRQRLSNEVTNLVNVPKAERKFLIEFENLIEKNLLDSTLSVEKLSQEMGMSRVQLFRKISALTNSNVVDYIGEYKLKKAKNLLLDHTKNIAEIAYELGFNNPSYFTTFFKQKTNQTPSEFRNG